MELIGRLINETLTLRGRLSVSGQPIIIGGEIYEGPYSVTPKVGESTVLGTQSKLMTLNVTVDKVPDYEVNNPQGGKTFIIGGNV